LFPSVLTSPVLASFFFNAPPPTHIYTLSLHDALPISARDRARPAARTEAHADRRAVDRPVAAAGEGDLRHPAGPARCRRSPSPRSEEHTSELQSRFDLVCRLLLEKKKKKKKKYSNMIK